MVVFNLSSFVEVDICNVVCIGKEVIVYEDIINFYGCFFVGYMVIDFKIGVGGYFIVGGENGGDLVVDLIDMLVIIIGVFDYLGVIGDVL